MHAARLALLAAGLLVAAILGAATRARTGEAPPLTATPTPEAPRSAAAPAAGSEPSLLTLLGDTLSAAHAAVALTAGDDRAVYVAALRARSVRAHDEAEELFRAVVARNEVLAPVAQLRLAQLLATMGRRGEAAGAFAAALARPDFPARLRVATALDAADNAVALQRPAEALAHLQVVREEPLATTTDRATAAWQAARIRRDGDDPRWSDDARAALLAQPASRAAREALDALESAAVPVPDLAAGFVRYRAFDDRAAAARYQAAAESASATPAEGAVAWFYLGALAERAEDTAAALHAYARSLALAPTGPLADDAIYWRARVYEARGEVAAAVTEHARLIAAFPASPFAADARLRTALALALAGDLEPALDRLEQIARSGAPADAAAAARWHTVLKTPDAAAARPTLDPRAHHPAALPALIGERATAPLPDPTRSERVAVPARDRGENAWIAQALGAEPVAPGAEGAVLRDARFLLARELATAGEPAIARALLRDLVAVARGRPHELVDLARAAAALGLHDVESAAGRTLLATISPAQQLSAPRSILALSYPLPFEQEMAESAREFGVPLLLLAALVRQESAFDPGAVSFAGARGLTQVIDSTGAQIARALGVPWSPAALLEPATSLRFGAYYFAHQLARFDGDVFAATAAYNAGGGSAQRWRDAQRLRGADGFLLAIDFEETRRFVPRVLENYAWYRYIYAGAPAPALR